MRWTHYPLTLTLLLLMLLCATPTAQARIKLVTLPLRERVEIQLEHEQVTLVEEERIIPLAAGVNEIDFSWNNTAINKESIQFRAVSHPEQIKVLSVSYPPNENALVWCVSSSGDLSAKVRISYIIGGLQKSFIYKALASHDEKTLTLRQYLRLHNFSNEEYGNSGVWLGFGDYFQKQIGLNETKELLSARFDEIPIVKSYTCDPAEFDYLDRGKNQLMVPMHYVIKNTKEAGLGRFPLQPGKVRIFQDDGSGGNAFIGEDWGPFTPLDDQMRLYLGVAKDVVVKRTIKKNEQHRLLGNLFNQEIILKYEIENFKDKPVTLDIREALPYVRNESIGSRDRAVQWRLDNEQMHTDWRDTDPTRVDADTVMFHVPLPARSGEGKAEKLEFEIHLWIENEW
ncbi:MAG: hypothetical protein HJJLKODD_00874 [Phycisphaerae bacterium]|nr:hypothetical protein [Phycisphaerae bacterium]